MKMIKGTELSMTGQKQALSMFVHRFTGTHKPNWANSEWKEGKPYPLQFKDDNDWLANSLFVVTTSGTLSNKARYCSSFPTWPNNPELRK